MAKGMRGGFGRPHSGSGNGGNNMQKMLQQAQRMQAEMEKEQEEIAGMTFETTAGGGAVKVVIKGDKTIDSIELSPDVVDPEDIEMLQDLIVAAVNEAVKKVDECTEERMGKYTAGLPI